MARKADRAAALVKGSDASRIVLDELDPDLGGSGRIVVAFIRVESCKHRAVLWF